MAIASKIMVAIALIVMPVGITLILEGSYFYNITSQTFMNNLLDQSVNEAFREQMSQFKEQCVALNITCSNLSETFDAVCRKSVEDRVEADMQAFSLCSQIGESCTNLKEALKVVCDSGDYQDGCNMLLNLEEQIEQEEEACTQMREHESQIEESKSSAYYKDVGGFSLAKINSMLENSLLIGFVIFILCLGLIYFATKDWLKVFSSVSITLVSTGFIIMIFWYFGSSSILTLLPSELAGKMPHSLSDFISDMLSFQKFVGMLLLSLGIIGFVAAFIIKKRFQGPGKGEKAGKKKAEAEVAAAEIDWI